MLKKPKYQNKFEGMNADCVMTESIVTPALTPIMRR